MSFFSELRRRNVVRAGLAWLALCWLLVVLADLLFPVLDLPNSAVRGLAVSLLGVLPLVLWLAWYYELSPQGLRVDRGALGDNPENARTARRIDQLIIVLVLLALALSALRQFALDRSPGDARDAPNSSVVAPASLPKPADQLPPAPPGPVDPRSLAVLAFTSMSPDPDNAYLAEGVAEEILNTLARIEGLKVASRTSSFAFRDNSPGAREIARQLGVAYVLDGSLRRQGNKIRITVELVQAAEDRHVWSETFNRELTDIFALQEEVAQAVVDALAEPLGVRTVTVRRATEDLEAYSLYLRGRQLFALRGANLEPARSLLRQAVERDPAFAEAWASLAGTLYVMPSYFPDAAAESSREAEAAATRALDLLPEQPEALAVRSRLSADAGRRGEALALIERALALDPNNANSWMWKGLALVEVGHVRAAREAFARGHELDPLSGIHFGWLGVSELIGGEAESAKLHLERAHALGWRGPASAWLLKHALLGGDREEIQRRYADWLRDDGRILASARSAHEAVAAAAHDPVQREAAHATLTRAVAELPEYDWTNLMLFAGLTDAAIDEALRVKPASGQILLMMIWSQADLPLRNHPRFPEIVARLGLPAFWAEHGAPDHCRWLEQPSPRLECDR